MSGSTSGVLGPLLDSEEERTEVVADQKMDYSARPEKTRMPQGQRYRVVGCVGLAVV